MNKSSLRAFLFIYGHLHVCIGFSLIVGWDSWWCAVLRFPFRRRIALVATTIDIVTAHTWWHTQAGATMTCCQWSEWDQEKFVRKNDFSEYLGRCSDLPRFPDDKAERAIPSLYIEFIQNGKIQKWKKCHFILDLSDYLKVLDTWYMYRIRYKHQFPWILIPEDKCEKRNVTPFILDQNTF